MKYEREKVKRKQTKKKRVREERRRRKIPPQEEKNSFEFHSRIPVSVTDKYSAVALTASQRSYFKKVSHTHLLKKQIILKHSWLLKIIILLEYLKAILIAYR